MSRAGRKNNFMADQQVVVAPTQLPVVPAMPVVPTETSRRGRPKAEPTPTVTPTVTPVVEADGKKRKPQTEEEKKVAQEKLAKLKNLRSARDNEVSNNGLVQLDWTRGGTQGFTHHATMLGSIVDANCRKSLLYLMEVRPGYVPFPASEYNLHSERKTTKPVGSAPKSIVTHSGPAFKNAVVPQQKQQTDVVPQQKQQTETTEKSEDKRKSMPRFGVESARHEFVYTVIRLLETIYVDCNHDNSKASDYANRDAFQNFLKTKHKDGEDNFANAVVNFLNDNKRLFETLQNAPISKTLSDYLNITTGLPEGGTFEPQLKIQIESLVNDLIKCVGFLAAQQLWATGRSLESGDIAGYIYKSGYTDGTYIKDMFEFCDLTIVRLPKADTKSTKDEPNGHTQKPEQSVEIAYNDDDQDDG